MNNKQTYHIWLLSLIVLVALVHQIVLSYPVIDVDSAKYGSISMEMLQRKSFIEVFDRFYDYLDKPPLLFWVSSCFLFIFGLKCWAYKIGSYIFLVVGSLYFRRFLQSQSSKYIADNWLLVWFSSIGFLYLLFNIKTEPLLLSGLLIAYPSLVWFIQKASFTNSLLSALGIAIGLLSKGPITIVVLGALLIPYFVKYLKIQLHWYWLLLSILVIMIISPMLIGLYQQFDLHPEKIVNNKTGVSGLRFYFWEQSFGRITGENQWKNKHDPFYLVHSLILFCLPFAHFAIAGMIIRLRSAEYRDVFTISMFLGIIIPITLLSTSCYQLPHYAYVSLPWFMYYVVIHYDQLSNNKWLKTISYILFVLFTTIAITLLYLCKYDIPIFNMMMSIVILIIGTFFTFKLDNQLHQLATCSVSFFGILVLTFGTLIAKYQPSNNIVSVVSKNNIDSKSQLVFYNRVSDGVEYHLGHRVPVVTYEEILSNIESHKCQWYYMAADALAMFHKQNQHISNIESLKYYDINRINMKFLIPKYREQLLEKRYLVQMGCE